MIVEADDRAIAEAARILRAGGLVAFPTETVYGLGADATNGKAVACIFEAKGRPRFNPLIAHVDSLGAARDLVEFNGEAEALAEAFWPGPLTLVLPQRPGARHRVSELVTAGLDTLAVRVPAHPVARQLIAAAGVPIAAPSANLSGRVSPTRARHVEEDLGRAVDTILDGGATEAGLESTIVAFAPAPTLLRPGGLAREDIEAVLGQPLRDYRETGVLSPGQLASHYAPRAGLRLDATACEPDELLLAFGPGAPEDALNLSPSGDLREAAANLFAHLRALDARGPAQIAVMPIPRHGLGEAINDRLRRASAPRSVHE
jgi:L-threonylcarbamoyladenylate synthase